MGSHRQTVREGGCVVRRIGGEGWQDDSGEK